ncbi:MAG: chemotaxis protein CheA, partial [Thermodesulfobacteriota bacterium]
MDDETLKIYIEESKEHLETIETDLLEIERGGADIDEDLVNKVFRAAHSIKGGGGFLALDNIKKLAHKIENILDLIRSYELTPTPDIVNTLLTSFDRLGELLDNAADSNEEDIEDKLAELTALTKGEKETAAGKEDGILSGPCFTVSEDDISRARTGGKILYILEYDLRKDIHLQGKTPQNILSNLEDTGEIISVQPELSKVGDPEELEPANKNSIYALFATIIEPDLISSLLDLSDDQITVIEQGREQECPALNFSAKKSAPQYPDKEKEPALEQESQSSVKSEEKNEKKPTPKKKGSRKSTDFSRSESLRVPVSVLDQLINRAGELVLSRNTLLQAILTGGDKEINEAGHRVDMVTSDLQKTIMLTRMQPIANIFNKYNRVVRDLARNLGKQIEITLEGKDVELDKTIIEGLGDPLTHLVRNSCDHGIESPAERKKKGKPETGHIYLRAFHESGQVLIEIEDDGKGLDPDKLTRKALEKGLITKNKAAGLSVKEKNNLIMKAGFSTSKEVSDVSGRGVGMDVVKNNLDKMGGQIDLISEIDRGTTVRIKLPLTLAIMPSILVSSAEERFALPQVNVAELLRIPASEVRDWVEKIGEADILSLRGELIPLLQLSNIMNLRSTYYDPKTGEFKPDRRSGLYDNRLTSPDSKDGDAEMAGKQENKPEERRESTQSDINVAILQAGSFRYGLAVDAVHDTVEIVVKPLGNHLKNCEVYAGATIMGDGRVALIIDTTGLARTAELQAVAEEAKS